MKYLKGSKLDYLITFGTELTILVCGVLVYRFANVLLSEGAFSEYAMARRSLSFIQPILFVGLAVGVPRFIAYSERGMKNPEVVSYFVAGTLILVSILVPFLIALNVFSTHFSWLLFGDKAYNSLIFPFSIMLLGVCLHGITYSYYRGRMKMVHANFLQLINLGAGITIPFFLGSNLYQVLLETGIFWFIISLIFFINIFIIEGTFILNVRQKMKELWQYGIQRMPGDISLAALLTIPAIAITHFYGIEKGGYVAFGISILNMVAAGFGPLSLILLPEASQLIREENYLTLKNKTIKVLSVTILITSIGLIIFEIFANPILTIYLKETNQELISFARIIFIGSIGYSVYVTMRSILDAYYIKAVNTRNIFISFFTYLLIGMITYFFISKNLHLHLFIFALSFLILGLLTYLEILKIFKIHKLKV